MTELLMDCDHFVAGAALIGGISYFHAYAYDLLAQNERIIASSCDAAITAHREGQLQKVTYMSSSMVFESATTWPSYEGQEHEIPPPLSSYGFQKLAVEYFAHAAHDQYGLPYTILRPFNCVGIGEGRATRRRRGAERQRQARDEPRRARPRTEGREGPGSAADPRRRHSRSATTPTAPTSPRASSTAIEHPGGPQRGLQPVDRPVDDGARAGGDHLAADQPRQGVPVGQRRAVRVRRPTTRAVGHEGQGWLGFEATTSLDEMLDVVVPWVVGAIDHGLI